MKKLHLYFSPAANWTLELSSVLKVDSRPPRVTNMICATDANQVFSYCIQEVAGKSALHICRFCIRGLNPFDWQLVESTDVRPEDMEACLSST